MALSLIDTRIASLVKKLNVEGIVSTSSCCEGHWSDDECTDGGVVNHPYIGFDTDIGFAANLNRALVQASPTEAGELHYHWIVQYGGAFILRPYFDGAVSRAWLDADFETIGQFVDEIAARARSNALVLVE